MRPEQRLARIAERQFGAFTLDQALRAGLTTDQAATDGRILAATLAAGADAWASHATAAALFGFGASDDAVDVSVAGRRRLEICGVRVHRPRQIPKPDRSRLGPIPVTSPSRTILDLAGTLDAKALEDALDEALRVGLVRTVVLLRRMDELRFVGKSVLRDLLLDRRDGHTESPLEARFLRLVRASRLPVPKLQYEIRWAGTFIARVDFAFVEPRVAVELDGYAYHSGKRRFDAGHDRDQHLIDAGWFPLHFTDRQVRQRPDAVVATVRRTIGRRLRGG